MFTRIHVADIGLVVVAMCTLRPSGVLNVVDVRRPTDSRRGPADTLAEMAFHCWSADMEDCLRVLLRMSRPKPTWSQRMPPPSYGLAPP